MTHKRVFARHPLRWTKNFIRAFCSAGSSSSFGVGYGGMGLGDDDFSLDDRPDQGYDS